MSHVQFLISTLLAITMLIYCQLLAASFYLWIAIHYRLTAYFMCDTPANIANNSKFPLTKANSDKFFCSQLLHFCNRINRYYWEVCLYILKTIFSYLFKDNIRSIKLDMILSDLWKSRVLSINYIIWWVKYHLGHIFASKWNHK